MWADVNQKNIGRTILISDKMDFQLKALLERGSLHIPNRYNFMLMSLWLNHCKMYREKIDKNGGRNWSICHEKEKFQYILIVDLQTEN